MGKTCALKAVGRDENVRAHLPGGVYWIAFPGDTTDEEAIEIIARAVRDPMACTHAEASGR